MTGNCEYLSSDLSTLNQTPVNKMFLPSQDDKGLIVSSDCCEAATL